MTDDLYTVGNKRLDCSMWLWSESIVTRVQIFFLLCVSQCVRQRDSLVIIDSQVTPWENRVHAFMTIKSAKHNVASPSKRKQKQKSLYHHVPVGQRSYPDWSQPTCTGPAEDERLAQPLEIAFQKMWVQHRYLGTPEVILAQLIVM